jgi:tape measure domain-containing protein
MALTDKDLELMLRIRADVSDALRKMGQMTKEVRDQGREMHRTGGQASSLSSGYQRLRTAVAAYLTVQTAIKALRLADDFQVLRGQIERSTKSQAEFNRVWARLYRISQDNGAALDATVRLFRGINRSASELGATTEQVLTVTNAIQQLAQLDRVGGAQLSGALLQLTQVFAGPVVQMQDLSSVIDAMPGLIQRVAEEMGKTSGQFILAVRDGKIYTKDFFEAVLAAAKKINTEMESVQTTIGKAGTQWLNSIQRLLGELDKATGVTSAIALSMSGYAGLIDRISDKLSEEERHSQDIVWLNNERIALLQKIEQLQARISVAKGTQKLGLENALKDAQAEVDALQERITAISKRVLDEFEQERNKPPEAASAKVDPAAAAQAAAEEAKRQDRIRSMIAALREQAETYGLNAEQVTLYRLALEGASAAQLAQARALIADIEAQREFDAANEQAIEQAKAEAEATAEWNAELDRQAQAWRDLTNPLNEYQRQIEQLQLLYELGKISADTYAEATFRIQDAIDAVGQEAEDTTQKVDQFALQAARNIQSALGDTLVAAASGDFDRILALWVQMLQRMAAEALAARLNSYLFGDFGTSGQLGGAIGSLLSDVFHSGGVVGSAGGQSRAVLPWMFIGAPRYHAGGLVGDEQAAILRKGEEVLTRDDPRHRANGGLGQGAQGIRIINAWSTSAIRDYLSSATGERVILNTIENNPGVIQQILRRL